MINGYLKNELTGSGMVVWKGREMYATGEMNREQFVDYISRGYYHMPHFRKKKEKEKKKKCLSDHIVRHLSDIATPWAQPQP